MNSWLRYFFLFIVVVFLQVTIGNSIHLLGVAIPFLYIYFIIRLPLSLSAYKDSISVFSKRQRRYKPKHSYPAYC
jgi:hypothetical protein